MFRRASRMGIVLMLAISACISHIDATHAEDDITSTDYSITIRKASTDDVLVISASDKNALNFEMRYHGQRSQPEILVEETASTSKKLDIKQKQGALVASTGMITATIKFAPIQISVTDANGFLVSVDMPRQPENTLRFSKMVGPYFGIRGFSQNEWPAVGVQRNDGGHVDAGFQGGSGAPAIFTPKFGVLVDSIDGDFGIRGDSINFANGSRANPKWFVIAGPPKTFWRVVTDLTGKPTLPPLWTLGFINSEWGTTQAEVESHIREYRKRRIPIDTFMLDFDFKAWGSDNYGEFRWNALNFPDGPSGAFADRMAQENVHLVGIMKPRVIVERADDGLTIQAEDFDRIGCWIDKQPIYKDYFSNKRARDVDFSKPGCREWYWQQLRHFYQTGIMGWWNDEADISENYRFDSMQHFNMARAEFEGQRRDGNTRVFSLNRNFYLGMQRYGAALWSGDIGATFWEMADQRQRMLAALNTGALWWTMDTGGFSADPSPELYARWMMFAAVSPIMRVHGGRDMQRQPWLFGPQAEKAARKALMVRYRLIPYLYALAHESTQTGVGPIRPMVYEFPDDPVTPNLSEQWMIGQSILVAPIVEQNQKVKRVYLPKGEWVHVDSNLFYNGPGWLDLQVDPGDWTTLPMFGRRGSVLPLADGDPQNTKEALEKTWLQTNGPTTQAHATLHNDDGTTNDFERGRTFEQHVTVTATGAQTLMELDRGVYGLMPQSNPRRLFMTNAFVREATLNGIKLKQAPQTVGFKEGTDPVYWPTEHGTMVRLPVGEAARLVLKHDQIKEIAPIRVTPTLTLVSEPGTPATCSEPKKILREVWADIGPRKDIDSLTYLPQFPDQPTFTESLTEMSVFEGSGKNFGERLTATLCVPFTGEYQFFIAGDNQAKLWMGSSYQTPLAEVSDWTYHQEWDKTDHQKSKPLVLTAGTLIMLTALHKADGFEDHISVAWRGPGFTRRPVSIFYR